MDKKMMSYFSTTPPLKIAGHVGLVAIVVLIILLIAGVINFSSGKEYFEVFMSTPEEVTETKMPDDDEKKRLEEEEKKRQVDEYMKGVAEYEQKYKAELEKAKAEKL